MQQRLILIAALGSALLLGGAFAFQHIGGMPPCKMCIWQRWPHGIAVVIGLVAALHSHRVLALGGALAALSTAGIGLYHTGVEQKWWQGPSTCSAGPIGDLSVGELMTKIFDAPLVRCDEIPWEMLGLSMAGWNMVLSMLLAVIWIAAARA